MKINDMRAYPKPYTFSELKAGEVYVSSRLQKYVMMTQDDATVCLESGEMFDSDEHSGDEFIHANAKLEILS